MRVRHLSAETISTLATYCGVSVIVNISQTLAADPPGEIRTCGLWAPQANGRFQANLILAPISQRVITGWKKQFCFYP